MSYIYALREATNTIFIINFFLNLLEAWLLLYTKNASRSEEQKKRNRKIFIILACMQWILISGLRSEYVGNDTQNYIKHFHEHRLLSWSTVFEEFGKFFRGDETALDFEPGFVLFERIVGAFTDSEVVYNFIVAIIFMNAFGRFVYQNSEDPSLSFLLYNGIFYNMFSLTGYRQVISVSIGIFWAFKYLKQRRFIPFLILVLIASTIHKSTLIFLPFYFISNIKLKKSYVITVSIVVILMIIFRNQLFNYVKTIVGYDEYTGMEASQSNFIALMFMFIIMAIWRYPLIIAEHPEAVIYYNGLIMAVMMLPFAMVSPTSMRLVYDFAFQMMFLLPLIVKTFTGEKDKLIVYSVVVILFGYFIIQKTPYYLFYWET